MLPVVCAPGVITNKINAKSTGVDFFTFYATTGAEKCNHQLIVATTRCVYIDQCELICIPTAGFALGFIFLSPPFSPIRFFCAIFLNLEPDFLAIFHPERARLSDIFRKKSLPSVFNPLNSGGLFYTH